MLMEDTGFMRITYDPSTPFFHNYRNATLHI